MFVGYDPLLIAPRNPVLDYYKAEIAAGRETVYEMYDNDTTVRIADMLKDLAFQYATKSGVGIIYESGALAGTRTQSYSLGENCFIQIKLREL